MGRDSINIIKINESRQPEWRRLYQSYAEFYKTSLSDNTAKIVWQWIIKGHIRALAAQDNLGGVSRHRPLAKNIASVAWDVYCLFARFICCARNTRRWRWRKINYRHICRCTQRRMQNNALGDGR